MADISELMDRDEFSGDIIKTTESWIDGDDIIPTCSLNVNDIAVSSIILPMPTGINSTVSPRWDMTDFEMGMSTARSISEGDISDALKKHGTGVLESMKRRIATLGGALAGVPDGSKIYDHLNQRIMNPFKEMLFAGIDFRQVQMDFELIPKSRKESTEIAKAIKMLQQYSLPEISGNFGVYLNYPYKWELKFYPGDEEYLPTFLPLVLNNISVDYGGGQLAFHKIPTGGITEIAPVQVNLSLAFVETELLTRDKIEGGYSG